MNLIQVARQASAGLSIEQIDSIFQSPTFILSAPRSGSTLLFEQLIKTEGYWSIGAESHAIFHQFPHLRFENEKFDSGALSAKHADPQTASDFKRALLLLAGDHQAQRYLQHQPLPQNIQFIEKTPRNALNVDFILSLFPKAKFIFLYRDPRENIASITEGWRLGQTTGQFVTYPRLPGFDERAWCFLLPKGWRSCFNKELFEIANFQWIETNKAIMDSLQRLSKDRWVKLSYQELISAPDCTLERLNHFCLNRSGMSDNPIVELALSKTTVSAPDPNKWRKYESEIMSLEPIWKPIQDRIADF